MKFKIWEISMLIALVAAMLFGTLAASAQAGLSDNIIRLHVLADSDSSEDQELKLKVRDGVLEEVSQILEGATNREQAQEIIQENIDKIESAAVRIVAENGKSDDVTASIGQESYPTREYETFSLPAGEYTSLRVVIGSGQGHNWWCVVFPPVCSSTAIGDTAAVSLTDDQISLITEESGRYVVKFKTMEIIGEIMAFFQK